MKYLLDVSVLLAWLWSDHEHHRRVIAWQKGKAVAICPITELGFVRISTQPAFGASMNQAREMLTDWHKKAHPLMLPCDLFVLDGMAAPSSAKTTDYYLADLAEKNDMEWATLDGAIDHPAAFLVPILPRS